MRMTQGLKAIIIIGIVGIVSSLEAVAPRKSELRTKDDFLK
ncbi:MAG: hypothetical protein H6P98_2020, partial [Candidatus Aminicenantes bacterium]|nr:hypothetical protein [Candidatus Aminicenantes bacterium]